MKTNKWKMIDVEENILTQIEKIHSERNRWVLYGTGNGAEKIWLVLKKLHIESNIKCVIDRQLSDSNNKFHGYDVITLDEVENKIDVIIIGAELNHNTVKKQIEQVLGKTGRKEIQIVDPFSYSVTSRDKDEYLDYIQNNKSNSEFTPISDESYQAEGGDSKVIAWYLPQFHQIDINNQYHGRGFTEWTNTSRVIPQFTGHYQPHIPYDVGYYDLLNPETLKRQSFLAHKYGIYGFGFFYYWFSGKRIMERPLKLLLEHEEININYCLHWATDDWSMAWYGGDQKIILKQEIPQVEFFWRDIAPFFNDQRYIKIEGKPLLVIYKCKMFEKDQFVLFLKELRKKAKESGFEGLYIMLSTGDGTFDCAEEWGGDALVEYQPWKLAQSKMIMKKLPCGYLNPNFKGQIWDIGKAIENKEYLEKLASLKYFRSAMVSWDNSARKRETNALIMLGNTPDKMKKWLADIMIESKRIHSREENFVFISSWNEWAEGSHLEPDYYYGYAWLEAVREAHEIARDADNN